MRDTYAMQAKQGTIRATRVVVSLLLLGGVASPLRTSLAAQVPNTNTVTLFDDGDPLYNKGLYDLAGAGRPAEAATLTGKTYSGHESLTVWGSGSGPGSRWGDRIAAFVRNDAGLDQSKDWYIELEVANDFVSPGYAFRFWLLPGQPPDARLLNSGDIRDRMTFSLGLGDQLPDENARGGFWIEAMSPRGLMGDILGSAGPRLDPVRHYLWPRSSRPE